MPDAWKMPPIVKVYEALGALGDGRVRLQNDVRALVRSSEGDKTYEVDAADGGREVSSTDNASYWQGYLGYPAIATLIERGILPKPPENVTGALADIPWKQINRRFRNDYTRTIAEVERITRQRGRDPSAIRVEAEAILHALRELAPRRGKRKPPPAQSRTLR